MKYQICDSGKFIEMAMNAKRKGYNRQVDVNKLIKLIDLDGVHVCKFSMIHTHIAGRKVAPHIRSIWMVKMKDKPSTSPVTIALDIDMKVFNELAVHDTEELKKA